MKSVNLYYITAVEPCYLRNNILMYLGFLDGFFLKKKRLLSFNLTAFVFYFSSFLMIVSKISWNVSF